MIKVYKKNLFINLLKIFYKKNLFILKVGFLLRIIILYLMIWKYMKIIQ